MTVARQYLAVTSSTTTEKNVNHNLYTIIFLRPKENHIVLKHIQIHNFVLKTTELDGAVSTIAIITPFDNILY